MGRVAEALKRAEQERRRLAGGGDPIIHSAVVDPPETTMVVDRPVEGAAERVAIVEPPGETAAVRGGIHESVVPYYDRSLIISEQYRSLRTRLLTLNPQNDHRVLAVTSAIPREGKSVTTANLSVILAEIRHFKVLCVDGDFRRSRLGALLDAKNAPGLADLLEGNASYEEVVQPTVVPNLFFVGAGETRGRTAAELLSSHRASAAIRRFQTEFHYTLVDTPPATTVTDVGIIGQMCSGVVLLVRLNFTPEPLARRAVRLLRANKIPIVGCLLIGRDDRTVGYGYSYDYYGYYYSSSNRDSERKQ